MIATSPFANVITWSTTFAFFVVPGRLCIITDRSSDRSAKTRKVRPAINGVDVLAEVRRFLVVRVVALVEISIESSSLTVSK